jgi:hypothetical protein
MYENRFLSEKPVMKCSQDASNGWGNFENGKVVKNK